VCLLTSRTLEPLPDHGEDGAEVHGVHVVGVAVHELSDDDAVGALRGVERVAVCEHVGRRREQYDAVVQALAAARHLHLHVREPCSAERTELYMLGQLRSCTDRWVAYLLP
jgi:hypothetical protein